MKIKVAWIGKTKSSPIQSLSAEYLKRLSHYADVEGLELKDEVSLLDAAGLGPHVRPKHTLVILDVRGKSFSSEEFAVWLRRYQDSNPLPILFAVGPADGLTEKICKKAHTTLSLSTMTLPHEMARVVLLEQLYRAFTILRGHPYHVTH